MTLLEFMADVRFAWRCWHQRPSHPIFVVLLLVIGISANTVVFSVVERLLISPLAVARPDTLVSFGRLSYPNYLSLTKRLGGVAGMAAFVNRPLTLTVDEPEPVRGTFVTMNYFTVLGVSALRGRFFGPTDAARTAVISEYFWRRAFGSNPAIIGRTLRLNNVAVRIIGVMPADFQGTTLEYATEVWVPLSLQREVNPELVDLRGNRRNPWVTVFARRVKDVPFAMLELATAQLAARGGMAFV